MDSALREQTRFIEDLRDKHRGEEIWILGCGPSLDDFPDDFFGDKISIALNWAIVAFPECTYWHGHHEEFREYLRDERPEFLPKSIILFPFPGPFKHGKIRQPAEFFGELTSQPIWMRYGDCRPIPKKLFEIMIEHIMAKEKCLYRTSMTVAHSAVAAAAVMGAKRITMVGCEHSPYGRAKNRGVRARYGSRQSGGWWARDPRGHNGTRWLAELFGKHGVEVIRYFYKDVEQPGLEHFKQGYQPINIKEAGNNGNKKV